MNTKYKTFNAGRAGSGRVNLATGGLEFVHEDTRLDTSILPLSVEHVYLSKHVNENSSYGKGFKLNLEQTLTYHENDETKWIYIDGNGIEHKFKERYYYINQENQKQFIDNLKPEHIRINQDGRLFLKLIINTIPANTEVFAEIKTRSGLQLYTQLKNFYGSHRLETRHQELVRAEEEIKSLERSRDELLFSVSQNENLEELASNASEQDILDLPEVTLEQKQRKYLLLKHKHEQITERNTQQIAWQINHISNEQESSTGLGSVDSQGRWLEELAASIAARGIRDFSGNDNATHRERLRNQFNIQQRFSARIELIQQNMNSILANFGEDRSLEDLNRIGIMLEQRQVALERIKMQLPVNFIIDGSVVYGFNGGGNLISVFDNYDNQVAILYEDNRIERVVGSDNKEIVFEYDVAGNLVSVVDCQCRKTEFYYENNLLVNITYPTGEVAAFGYNENGLLDEIISPSGIGIKLGYDGSNFVQTIAQKTYALDGITSKGVVQSNEFVQEELFLITYNSGLKITTIEDLKGVKEVYYFNSNWELFSEYCSVNNVPTRVALYDSNLDYKSEGYELAIARINPYLLSQLEVEGIIELFKNKVGNWSLKEIESRYSADEYAWVFSEFEHYNKIAEYHSETIRTNADGQVSIRVNKEFKYDRSNNLISETVFETQAITENNSEAKINIKDPQITRFEHNKQGNLIRVVSNYGMISETMYDVNGNILRTLLYHQDDPTAKFVQEQDISDNGQIKSELNEFGEVVAKFEYKPGSNTVNSIVDAQGNKTSFGIDPHSDELLGITATAGGEVNKVLYQHTADYLTKLTSGNTNVEYTYDKWGRKAAIILNEEEHVSFEYLYDNTVITKYASGDEFKTITDSWGRVTSVQRKDAKFNFCAEVVQNQYCEKNPHRLLKSTDRVTQEETVFEYDADGNLLRSTQGNITITPFTSLDGNTQTLTYDIGGKAKQIYSKTIKNGEAVAIELLTGDVVEIERDGLGRLKKVETPIVAEEYGYLQHGDRTSGLINLIKRKIGNETTRTRYNYDVNGNIIEVIDNLSNITAKYEYDGLNRLVREYTQENEIEISYDNNGNILFKKDLSSGDVIEYTYDKDQLTSFNGEKIGDYDALGNPRLYRNANLEWDFRNLKKFDCTEFEYDAKGLRRSKIHGDTRSEYIWVGDKLLAEKRTRTSTDLEIGGHIYKGGHHIYAQEQFIEYIHGVDGMAGFKRNDVPYWFVKNLFGDVEEVRDVNGNLVAEYTYDAWGSHLCISQDGTVIGNSKTGAVAGFENHIGNLNPIRYRGYYWDAEISFYYLKTRYYDPEVGRFINADAIQNAMMQIYQINGLNLFAYCLNNPIMNVDPYGEFVLTAFGLAVIIGIASGMVVGGTIGGITAAANGTSIAGGILGGAFMGGAMGGLMVLGGGVALGVAGGIGLAKGLIISATVGIGAGLGSYSIEAGFNGNWNIHDFGWAGINGMAQGMFTFGMGFIGGKYFGAFDALRLSPFMKGVPEIGRNLVYSFGKHLMGRTAFMTPMAELILRTIILGGIAGGGRAGINALFGF